MSKQGFIQLHRRIQDHWLYQEKRTFSKFEAWVDLILMASHKDNKFLLGNELIEIKRGQFVTSELKLMEKWGWGKSKTRNFLSLLEKDGMIVKKSDRKKTTITICNYSVYHDNEKENRPQTDYEQTTSEPRTDTINNVKNVKNVEEVIPYVEIINYLNDVADKQYRHSTRKTKDLIKARWNEGFTLDDFKQVIDIKNEEWKNNEKMNKFIRPETLFSPKFEGYLNQENKGTPSDNQFDDLF